MAFYHILAIRPEWRQHIKIALKDLTGYFLLTNIAGIVVKLVVTALFIPGPDEFAWISKFFSMKGYGWYGVTFFIVALVITAVTHKTSFNSELQYKQGK